MSMWMACICSFNPIPRISFYSNRTILAFIKDRSLDRKRIKRGMPRHSLLYRPSIWFQRPLASWLSCPRRRCRTPFHQLSRTS